MINIAIFFAATQIFSFHGGTIQDLVAELAHSTQRNCIAEIYDGDQYIRSMRASADLKILAKTIALQTGYSLTLDGDTLLLTTGFVAPVVHNFRGEKYPQYKEKVSPIGVDATYRKLKHLPKIKLKRVNDVVSLATGGDEFLTLADLSVYSTVGNSWKADWPFLEVPLAVSVCDMEPRIFLTEIGHALGARVVENKKRISLEFSGANYRKRFIHSASDPMLLDLVATDVDEGGNPGVASSRLHFRKEAIQQLSDGFLEEAFAKRGQFNGRITFDSRPKLKKICDEYAFNLISALNRSVLAKKITDSYVAHDLQTIDVDTKPEYFFYHAPAEFYIALHEKDANLMLLWR